MAYSTPAQVRMALVPTNNGTLPDPPSNTAADLSEAQLNDAIAEADSVIDGYLSRFYTTPVAEVEGVIPHPVDYWSRNLAAYAATISYRGSMDFTDNDPVARRYRAVIDLLKDVAAGKVTLNLPTDGDEPGGRPGAGQAINPYEGDLWVPEDFVQPGTERDEYRHVAHWHESIW